MSLSAHRLRMQAGTDPPFFDGVKNTEVPGMRKAGQAEFKHLSIFYVMAYEMHGQERFGRETYLQSGAWFVHRQRSGSRVSAIPQTAVQDV